MIRASFSTGFYIADKAINQMLNMFFARLKPWAFTVLTSNDNKLSILM
jgi:hypothetical protein